MFVGLSDPSVAGSVMLCFRWFEKSSSSPPLVVYQRLARLAGGMYSREFYEEGNTVRAGFCGLGHDWVTLWGHF